MDRIGAAVAAVTAAVLLSAGTARAATTPPSPSVTAATTAPSSPAPTPLERTVAYVAPSVVYLSIGWEGWVYDTHNKQFLNDGEPFTAGGQCTGFAVSPDGYIASAGHCVEYDADIKKALLAEAAAWAKKTGFFTDTAMTAEDIAALEQLSVTSRDRAGSPTRKVFAAWAISQSGSNRFEEKPARVISFQKFKEGDAALLKVEADDLNALTVAAGTTGQVGQEIISVGFPASVEEVTDLDLNSASYKTGKISSTKTMEGGLLKVYEVDAAISPGMSGGPTVDTSGRVLGINSFGIRGESQPFNFVAPSERLVELMSAAGVRNVLSATGDRYRAGLDAYFAGDKQAAVAALSSVVQSQPSHSLAASYLRKANALPDPVAVPTRTAQGPVSGQVDEGSDTALLLGGAGSVIILLLAGIALILWRTRRQHPAAPALASPSPEPAAAAVPPPGTAWQAERAHPSAPPPMARPEAFCGSCGTQVAAGQRFCGNCGQPANPA